MVVGRGAQTGTVGVNGGSRDAIFRCTRAAVVLLPRPLPPPRLRWRRHPLCSPSRQQRAGWVPPHSLPLTPPPPRPLLISLSPLRPVRLPPLPRPARADGVVATFFSGTEVCLARPPAHPPPLPARPPVRASLPRHRDVGPGREAPSGWRRPRLPQSLPSPSLSAVCLCVSKYVRRRPRCTPARVIVPRTRQPVCQ